MVFMILIGKIRGLTPYQKKKKKKIRGLTWDCEDEGKESNGWHSRAV